MKFALFVLSLVILAGCGNTPREKYRSAVVLYDGAAIGLGAANQQKPFPPATWTQIQNGEGKARDQLKLASDWLVANPTLADTPGAPFPPLDPANVALDFLLSELSGVQGVVLVSPTVPTTQP